MNRSGVVVVLAVVFIGLFALLSGLIAGVVIDQRHTRMVIDAAIKDYGKIP